jgi:hypothetical protein
MHNGIKSEKSGFFSVFSLFFLSENAVFFTRGGTIFKICVFSIRQKRIGLVIKPTLTVISILHKRYKIRAGGSKPSALLLEFFSLFR